MTEHEALAFIAALSRQVRERDAASPTGWRRQAAAEYQEDEDDLFATEADELMDEMDVSEELRELVVADVVGGQYQCADCFPDGCGARAEEHYATWREKELCASDVWDQPVSRIALIHEIAKGQEEE